MICPQCFEIVPDDYRYCLQCGADLGAITAIQSKPKPTPPGQLPTVPFKDSPKKETEARSTTYWILLSVLLLGIVGLVAMAVLGGLYFYHQSTEVVANPTPTPQLIARPSPVVPATPSPVYAPSPLASPSPGVHDLITSSVAVGARTYSSIPFDLPTTARVVGSFQAQGGRNDIWAYVMDREGFTDFTNGQSAKTYFNTTGYVNTAQIDLVLGPGSYWLVFDNRRAILTDKVVEVRLAAVY